MPRQSNVQRLANAIAILCNGNRDIKRKTLTVRRIARVMGASREEIRDAARQMPDQIRHANLSIVYLR